MKSNEDKVIDAIVEIGQKPNKGIFEVMAICLKHFGDNVKEIKLSGSRNKEI